MLRLLQAPSAWGFDPQAYLPRHLGPQPLLQAYLGGEAQDLPRGGGVGQGVADIAVLGLPMLHHGSPADDLLQKLDG